MNNIEEIALKAKMLGEAARAAQAQEDNRKEMALGMGYTVQKKPVERIAIALERIATALERL